MALNSIVNQQFLVKTSLAMKVPVRITACCSDITTLKVDAIVNAANCSLLGGGGVDAAIHTAAGPKLLEECIALGGCDTGEAKITSGYNLPAKYVIHTPGPIGEIPELLSNSYRNSLDFIITHKIQSIAFPCISTGVYNYPFVNATHVVLKTLKEWLEINADKTRDLHVYFCTFKNSDLQVYNELIPKYFDQRA
ncbi:hypothetical protein BB561_004683 [Smittium simulii]|uniref:Macro domain-containing protein n=1 Tax=Smittium simulii TaxID=133385 RepID=A0A2T9YET8_9FUNG|nr:hypothetical protein BB561_004683 [Smittium simulii]